MPENTHYSICLSCHCMKNMPVLTRAPFSKNNANFDVFFCEKVIFPDVSENNFDIPDNIKKKLDKGELVAFDDLNKEPYKTDKFLSDILKRNLEVMKRTCERYTEHFVLDCNKQKE